MKKRETYLTFIIVCANSKDSICVMDALEVDGSDERKGRNSEARNDAHLPLLPPPFTRLCCQRLPKYYDVLVMTEPLQSLAQV